MLTHDAYLEDVLPVYGDEKRNTYGDGQLLRVESPGRWVAVESRNMIAAQMRRLWFEQALRALARFWTVGEC